MAFNLHDLKVIGIPLTEILDCRVDGRIGAHANLTIHAYLEQEEEFLYELPSYHPIEVQLTGATGQQVLFAGIVTDVSLYQSADMKMIKITGKSYSWLMDLTKKSRSFQTTEMTYEALANQVIGDYPGSSLFFAAPPQPIGKLIVQYEETDWEFLKRLMSMLGLTVTPDSQRPGIMLYAGVPDLELQEISHRVLEMNKDLASYYYLQANGRSVFDVDFTKYVISSEQLMGIFQLVKRGSQSFTIHSFRYQFKHQEMVAVYGLQRKQGLVAPAIYPMHLIGVALIGKIVNVSGDKVQVALEIDRESGNPAVYWFTYSTISASPDGSGWYCMPEVGDDVRVYFPSKDEKEAIALSAVSNYDSPGGGQPDRMGDPNSRYLRTKDGQELALAPGFLKLSCGEGLSSVTIGEDGKISISAQNVVKVIADKDVTLHADEEIHVHAQEGIMLQSLQGGNVAMGDGNIQFQGTEVKFD